MTLNPGYFPVHQPYFGTVSSGHQRLPPSHFNPVLSSISSSLVLLRLLPQPLFHPPIPGQNHYLLSVSLPQLLPFHSRNFHQIRPIIFYMSDPDLWYVDWAIILSQTVPCSSLEFRGISNVLVSSSEYGIRVCTLCEESAGEGHTIFYGGAVARSQCRILTSNWLHMGHSCPLFPHPLLFPCHCSLSNVLNLSLLQFYCLLWVEWKF